MRTISHLFRPGPAQQRGPHAAGGLWEESEDSEGPCSTVWPPAETRGPAINKRKLSVTNGSSIWDFFDGGGSPNGHHGNVTAWTVGNTEIKEQHSSEENENYTFYTMVRLRKLNVILQNILFFWTCGGYVWQCKKLASKKLMLLINITSYIYGYILISNGSSKVTFYFLVESTSLLIV